MISSATDVECDAPDVDCPVIVNVNTPVVAVVMVATVKVALCPAVTAAGRNVPVAPAGSPPSDRLTVRAVPEVSCVATVYDVPDPWTIVLDEGLALIAKSSGTGALTVRLTAVECVGPEAY